MANNLEGQLLGSEIHGFHTLQELDVRSIMEEARTRWLRPNEIHAILCNFKYFTTNVKPMNFPKSGTIVLFHRKMLRNFRKDGHNWKKKKDGKTVKQANEHLKALSRRATLYEIIRDYAQAASDLRRLVSLLSKGVEDNTNQLGISDRSIHYTTDLKQKSYSTF